jgi:hypothetical protein
MIKLEHPGSFFLWMGSYFGFSAICMLGLALRLRNQDLSHCLKGKHCRRS